MLTIIVEGGETFDEETNTFGKVEGAVLDLEHSLISLSKWESIHQKPFLSSSVQKTAHEMFDYIKMMCVTTSADLDKLFPFFSDKNLVDIQEYIDSKQSATTFGQMPESKGPSEPITSELIYYWLLTFNIPFEVETWHLNRLFALIRICNIKNSKPKKMSKQQVAEQNRALNAQRKAELGTSG